MYEIDTASQTYTHFMWAHMGDWDVKVLSGIIGKSISTRLRG